MGRERYSVYTLPCCSCPLTEEDMGIFDQVAARAGVSWEVLIGDAEQDVTTPDRRQSVLLDVRALHQYGTFRAAAEALARNPLAHWRVVAEEEDECLYQIQEIEL